MVRVGYGDESMGESVGEGVDKGLGEGEGESVGEGGGQGCRMCPSAPTPLGGTF
jgi:hypothetical protein